MADRVQLAMVGIIGLILGALGVTLFSGDDIGYRYGPGFGPVSEEYGESLGYGPGYVPAYGPGYRAGPGTMGPGMMHDYGHDYGHGYQAGPGMMGIGTRAGGMGMMALYFPDETPISENTAKELLETFAARYGDGVEVEDFMIFSNNYYAQVVDSKTGESLAEILADRYTGVVYPEPGPNMAWNTLFGAGGAAGPARYGQEEARDLAETFLEGYLPGSGVFQSSNLPGYYTFDFGREEIEGMLSVNAQTGDIWVHTWHGFYLGGHDPGHS